MVLLVVACMLFVPVSVAGSRRVEASVPASAVFALPSESSLVSCVSLGPCAYALGIGALLVAAGYVFANRDQIYNAIASAYNHLTGSDAQQIVDSVTSNGAVMNASPSLLADAASGVVGPSVGWTSFTDSAGKVWYKTTLPTGVSGMLLWSVQGKWWSNAPQNDSGYVRTGLQNIYPAEILDASGKFTGTHLGGSLYIENLSRGTVATVSWTCSSDGSCGVIQTGTISFGPNDSVAISYLLDSSADGKTIAVCADPGRCRGASTIGTGPAAQVLSSGCSPCNSQDIYAGLNSSQWYYSAGSLGLYSAYRGAVGTTYSVPQGAVINIPNGIDQLVGASPNSTITSISGQSVVLNPAGSISGQQGLLTQLLQLIESLPSVISNAISSVWAPATGATLDLTPLAQAVSGLTTAFPFSLPWDFIRILGLFDVTPIRPSWTLTVFNQSVTISIPSQVDNVIQLVRDGEVVAFAVLLMIATRRLGVQG